MSKAQRIYVYGMNLIAGLVLLASALVLSRWAVLQAVAGRLFPLAPGALRRPPLMPWLWIALAALLVWGIHWALASRAAKRPAERGSAERGSAERGSAERGSAERGSAARKAYLYLMQLAALLVCLYMGGLLAGEMIGRFLQRPPQPALPWPQGLPASAPAGAALASAVGLLIGFVTWAFHRWIVLRDGDFGKEPPGAAGWRRFYFYLATGIGVVLMAAGAVQFLRSALMLWSELSMGGAPGAATWRAEVVAGLTELALGAPLAILAWHGANQPVAAAPAVEVNAPIRLLFLRVGAFLGTTATLLALFVVVRQFLLLSFSRQLGQTEPLWTDQLIMALAVAPVGVAAWLAFAAALRDDVAVGGEGGAAATLRRVHFYVITGAALAGLWYGMSHLLRVMLPLALDAFSSVRVGLPVSPQRLSLAAALVLVGAPAWWGHWWPQQVRARAFTQEGFAERASAMRQLYLYTAIAAASALVLVSLGLTIFALFGGRMASLDHGDTVVLMTGTLATGLTALVWWLVHVLALRADRQSQQAWIRVEYLTNAAAPPIAAAAFAGPRSISRETLTPLVIAASVARPPAQTVAVVDGGDGATGAALVSALRSAFPAETILPLGLTPAAQAAMARALGQPDTAAPAPDMLAHAAVIIGGSDMLSTGANPEIATALADGQARILLLPPRDPRQRWVAAPDWPLARWIENAVAETREALESAQDG